MHHFDPEKGRLYKPFVKLGTPLGARHFHSIF